MEDVRRMLIDAVKRIERAEKALEYRSNAHHELGNRMQRVSNDLSSRINSEFQELDRKYSGLLSGTDARLRDVEAKVTGIMERQTTNTSRIDRIEKFVIGVLIVIALAFLGSLFAMVGLKP